MGILQIANHMVCSTFRSSLSFHFQRSFSISNMYSIWIYLFYRKKDKFVLLYTPSIKTMKHRWRVRMRRINLSNSFHGLQPTLQRSLTHRKDVFWIAWPYFFFSVNPIHGSFTVKWKEGLFFLNWRTPKEERRHKKNDHHEKEVKMILLNWLHS